MYCISTIGPDVSIQVNETDIPVGSQAAISCTMVSSLGIVSVNWTLDDTSIDLSKAKYEGIVHGTHTLKINDFQWDDIRFLSVTVLYEQQIVASNCFCMNNIF
jgi:hypothetical protein